MVSTNFPNGVTNVLESAVLGQMRRPVPVGNTFGYWDDFAEPISSTDGAPWAIDSVGTTVYGTADGVGGIATITTAGADNDHTYAQLLPESFILASNKELWFSTRIALDDVVQSDWIAGLYVTDTTPIAGITDGCYFIKSDGAATVDFVSVVGSTATTLASIATLVNDTFARFDYYWDGVEYIHVFVDEVLIGRVAASARPTGELALSWVIQTGEAAAKALSMDWIGAELVR